MADADGKFSNIHGGERSGLSMSAGNGTSGPCNGFWRGSDWVLTRPARVGDPPSLRPVGPGTFPLAHGTTARLGRLRGYGDGIVAQVAAAFIQAYMKEREI
jgi:DNA (cytosine-5)-methyltransferase 1